MQSVYLQRIMKKNADRGYEKTKPKQTQSNPISKGAPVLRKRFLQKLLSAVALAKADARLMRKFGLSSQEQAARQLLYQPLKTQRYKSGVNTACS